MVALGSSYKHFLGLPSVRVFLYFIALGFYLYSILGVVFYYAFLLKNIKTI